MPTSTDPFNLDRFVQAQAGVYEQALAELRAGQKRSHWMWFIFPQVAGLGFSATSEHYGIRSVDEARAYLDHLILGARLKQCADALMGIEGRTAMQIFGSPDHLKLRSCATLFAIASPPGSVFDGLLARYYDGARDELTLRRVQSEAP
jgi:uncharacterized protein (DUF1810 family)